MGIHSGVRKINGGIRYQWLDVSRFRSDKIDQLAMFRPQNRSSLFKASLLGACCCDVRYADQFILGCVPLLCTIFTEMLSKLAHASKYTTSLASLP